VVLMSHPYELRRDALSMVWRIQGLDPRDNTDRFAWIAGVSVGACVVV